ncbi:MAG: hypothetical protein FWF70_08310 [Bacteroidetes bacterium]|nr:hypothetical protein [Bacteroidota bacterium]MCL1968255.1 hypothetical protein [Bacteroidota bacterium]
MKKVVILLIAATALISFSCNKYCYCKHYIDGVLDKNYTQGEFVNESGSCADYNEEKTIEGVTYELKCK